jgi:hypothetical protein
MLKYEFIIILINILLLSFTYLWFFQKVAGNDIKKLSIYDLLTSLISLMISGFLFWESGIEFTLFVVDMNWFWFTFVTYFIVEIPIALWYFKKYDVFKTL